MTWKPPESEDAWQECLSAYLDGEMDADGRVAMEQVLKQDERRAEQLRRLRRLSGTLQEWQVEVPEPPAQLAGEIRGRHDDKADGGWKAGMAGWLLPLTVRWRAHAVLFIAGVLLGVFGTRFGGGFRSTRQPPGVDPQSAQSTPAVEDMRQVISSSQAKSLLREVARAGQERQNPKAPRRIGAAGDKTTVRRRSAAKRDGAQPVGSPPKGRDGRRVERRVFEVKSQGRSEAI